MVCNPLETDAIIVRTLYKYYRISHGGYLDEDFIHYR